jgi:hypothetical protein
MSQNYFSILPPELIPLILSSNEIWLLLEMAFPSFARYCRENKLSYYNQFIKKITYPRHIIDTEKMFKSYNITHKIHKVSKSFDNCLCYFCLLKNKDNKEDTNNEDMFGGFYNSSIKKIPLIYQNETTIWMFENKIHRDHAPAIYSAGYECYMKMDMKHRFFAPAEINRTCGVEDFYENGRLCDGIDYKKYVISHDKQMMYEEGDILADYYARELSLSYIESKHEFNKENLEFDNNIVHFIEKSYKENSSTNEIQYPAAIKRYDTLHANSPDSNVVNNWQWIKSGEEPYDSFLNNETEIARENYVNRIINDNPMDDIDDRLMNAWM